MPAGEGVVVALVVKSLSWLRVEYWRWLQKLVPNVWQLILANVSSFEGVLYTYGNIASLIALAWTGFWDYPLCMMLNCIWDPKGCPVVVLAVDVWGRGPWDVPWPYLPGICLNSPTSKNWITGCVGIGSDRWLLFVWFCGPLSLGLTKVVLRVLVPLKWTCMFLPSHILSEIPVMLFWVCRGQLWWLKTVFVAYKMVLVDCWGCWNCLLVSCSGSAEHNGKCLKAVAYTISEFTPLHVLKTLFCLETGFLSVYRAVWYPY